MDYCLDESGYLYFYGTDKEQLEMAKTLTELTRDNFDEIYSDFRQNNHPYLGIDGYQRIYFQGERFMYAPNVTSEARPFYMKTMLLPKFEQALEKMGLEKTIREC